MKRTILLWMRETTVILGTLRDLIITFDVMSHSFITYIVIKGREINKLILKEAKTSLKYNKNTLKQYIYIYIYIYNKIFT